MNTLLKKWNGKVIEDWGGYQSDEWKSFCRSFKSAIRRNSAGFEIAGDGSFKSSHYFVSGFVQKEGKTYYISYDYDRGLPVELSKKGWAGPILWRRAKDTKDYRGDVNHFTTAQDLFDEIEADYERWCRQEVA